MAPIRGCSTLEVLPMVTFLLVRMTKHFTNKTLQSNNQHEVRMWGKKRKGGESAREWLAVIKSHFNLSKKKKCSYQISYCPQLVVYSPLPHPIHHHPPLFFFQMCEFLDNTDFDISHNIEWLKNHYNQQSLQSTG